MMLIFKFFSFCLHFYTFTFLLTIQIPFAILLLVPIYRYRKCKQSNTHKEKCSKHSNLKKDLYLHLICLNNHFKTIYLYSVQIFLRCSFFLHKFPQKLSFSLINFKLTFMFYGSPEFSINFLSFWWSSDIGI